MGDKKDPAEPAKSILLPQRSDTNTIRIMQRGVKGTHKLLNIRFHTDRNDNLQIFVQPYLKRSTGLLSFCVQKPGQNTLSLLPGGYVTSHTVKYSHPVDGKAHFSSSSKIFTVIRNQARRLDDLDGSQLFSITIHDYDAFKSTSNEKVNSNENVYLETNEVDDPKILRIAGWWYHSSMVKVNKKELGPSFVYEKEGIPRWAIMIAPFFEDSKHPLSQYFLLLDFKFEDAPVDPSNYTIMAGFDPKRTQEKKFKFLVCTYPSANHTELERQIGSIDYKPGQEAPPLKIFEQ